MVTIAVGNFDEPGCEISVFTTNHYISPFCKHKICDCSLPPPPPPPKKTILNSETFQTERTRMSILNC